MSYNNYNRGYAEPTMTSADYMTRTYRWMALGPCCSMPVSLLFALFGGFCAHHSKFMRRAAVSSLALAAILCYNVRQVC